MSIPTFGIVTDHDEFGMRACVRVVASTPDTSSECLTFADMTAAKEASASPSKGSAWPWLHNSNAQKGLSIQKNSSVQRFERQKV